MRVERVFRLLGLVLGLIAGVYYASFILTETHIQGYTLRAIVLLLTALAGALFGFFGLPYVTTKPFFWLENKLNVTPLPDLVAATVGLLVGLLLAALVGLFLAKLPWYLGFVISLIVALVFAYWGVTLVLNLLQKEPLVDIEFIDEDVPDVTEVDMKLIKLATRRNAAIMTNDYNLNRVAQLEGVRILNLNNLANALKPVVIPGEEMNVQVIKEGKEQNQGVAYLDDGTMIVVENGRRYINQTIGVVVTSVLQTAAGRMIFATPASESTIGRPKPLRRASGGGGTGR